MNKTNEKAMDMDVFLALRNHLSIAHHIPGRIRLRIAPAVRKDVGGVDPKLFDRVMGAIDGIRDVRINAMAGSVVISYTTNEIEPSWWEMLVNGDDGQAIALLRQLLETRLAPAVAAVRSA